VPKALTQRRFESWIELARTALKRSELATFAAITQLLKADADALSDTTVSVRTNWQAVQQARDAKLLDQFAPTLVQVLQENVAPLMNSLDVRGQGDALRWDLLVAKAQMQALQQPGKPNPVAGDILALLDRLPPNLSQVRAKAADLKHIRSDAFWQNADFVALEAKRIALRDIIQLAEPLQYMSPLPPPVIDVEEDQAEYQVETRKTHIRSVDASIYQKHVQAALQPLFDSDPVLQKIRAGAPVSPAELQQLNSLIHTRNPNVDLDTLREFYPDTAVGLDQILRMITGELKNRIDSLWTDFWTGGITNPLTVIEQITFLMYSRLLDMQERRTKARIQLTGQQPSRRFLEGRAGLPLGNLAPLWRRANAAPCARPRVPALPRSGRAQRRKAAGFAAFMKDAQLMIQKPSLLVKAVNAVQDLPLERGDTKGDLYEYLLGKLTTAGINGQFRTPRHIIRLMVELMQPAADRSHLRPILRHRRLPDRTYDYLLRQHSSAAGTHTPGGSDRWRRTVTYSGDLLTPHRRTSTPTCSTPSISTPPCCASPP
jgi:hypothetical protein